MLRGAPRPSVEPRRSRWTPLGLALLCAHCSLSGAAAAFALFGGASAVVLGVDLNYVWPPVLIVGLFAWWLWSGRAKGEADACAAPYRP